MTTPNMQPILDRFYGEAEETARQAQALDADAKQHSRAITENEMLNDQDRVELAELEHRARALRTQISSRTERVDKLRGELRAIEQRRDDKHAEAQAIIAIVNREKDRLAKQAQRERGLPPGVTAVPPASTTETIVYPVSTPTAATAADGFPAVPTDLPQTPPAAEGEATQS